MNPHQNNPVLHSTDTFSIPSPFLFPVSLQGRPMVTIQVVMRQIPPKRDICHSWISPPFLLLSEIQQKFQHLRGCSLSHTSLKSNNRHFSFSSVQNGMWVNGKVHVTAVTVCLMISLVLLWKFLCEVEQAALHRRSQNAVIIPWLGVPNFISSVKTWAYCL